MSAATPSRFRFSLRAVLLLITLASIWLGWRVKKVREADAAIAVVAGPWTRIERARISSGLPNFNPGHEFFPKRPYWQRILAGEGGEEWVIDFFNHEEPLTDQKLIRAIAALERLDDVTHLTVEWGAITDESLQHVPRLKELRIFAADSSTFTDAGVLHLEKLPHLEHLTLKSTRPKPETIDRLRKALPRCRIEIGQTVYPPLQR